MIHLHVEVLLHLRVALEQDVVERLHDRRTMLFEHGDSRLDRVDGGLRDTHVDRCVELVWKSWAAVQMLKNRGMSGMQDGEEQVWDAKKQYIYANQKR